MSEPTWHPGTLLQLSGSYWQTFTLHAGVKLDVFTSMAEQPLDAAQAATRTGADARAMAMLLNALSAMQLLKKDQESGMRISLPIPNGIVKFIKIHTPEL